MDGIRSGATAKIQETPAVAKIDMGHDSRRNLHGKIKHSHLKAFPLFILIPMGVLLPDRSSAPDSLIQMGPGSHQEVMVEQDMAKVAGRGARKKFGGNAGSRKGIIVLFQQTHGRQGMEQHRESANIAFYQFGQFCCREGTGGKRCKEI
jgi:hypothetical protein